MKERPILFSAPMVRGILEGRKTMTRRVVKPQPPEDCGDIRCSVFNPTVVDRNGLEHPGIEVFGAWSFDGDWGVKCPYGVPGDQLWVRESFFVQQDIWSLDRGHQPVHYAATSNRSEVEDYIGKPSIHMPRWASRIQLEITGVRVERLQAISEEDAKTEGVERCEIMDAWEDYCDQNNVLPSAVQSFASLWTKINGMESWDANPWVWVVEFRRIKP